jgi:hypothetical protein
MKTFFVALALLGLAIPYASAQGITANSLGNYNYPYSGADYDISPANPSPSTLLSAGSFQNRFDYPGLGPALAAIGKSTNNGYTFNFINLDGYYEVHTANLCFVDTLGLWNFPGFTEGSLFYPTHGYGSEAAGVELGLQYFPGNAGYNNGLCWMLMVSTQIYDHARHYTSSYDSGWFSYMEIGPAHPNCVGEWWVVGTATNFDRELIVEWAYSYNNDQGLMMFLVPFYYSQDLNGSLPTSPPGTPSHVLNLAQYGLQFGWYTPKKF